MEQDQVVLDIATAPHADSKFWRQGTTTWADMCEMVDSPADYKECGSYLPGRLKGNRRTQDTILSRSMVTLDADTAKPTLPDMVELVLGYGAIVHTTFRSTPEAPRYRVIVQLDRSVTPAEYRTLVWVLTGKLGRDQFDKSTGQPERYMFLPSRDPEHPEAYGAWVIDGPPAPVDELIAGVAALVPETVEPPAPAVRVEMPALPEEYVTTQVERTLGDLRALTALGDGERLDWPGHAEGVGWDMGGLYIAGRLIEAANSGTAYDLDAARADWDELAPPNEGSFDREHKWSESLKHVGGRPLPYVAPDEDFEPVEGEGGDGPKPAGEMHSGQIRMAYRLAAAYSDRLLHVHGIGWHWWDGHRWAPDDRGRAERAVVTILKKALSQSVGNPKLRTDVGRCESNGGVDGVLGVASFLEVFAHTPDQMDADPFLYNMPNGTLDLRERVVRKHDPADLITKVSRGAYDPSAPRDVWEGFLEQVLPDVDERNYLRRVVGQALFGAVREHLFPVLTGVGANGKGTTYTALVNAWGDYGVIISPDLLMTSKNAVGGVEMMVLRGARLVASSEIGQGRVLDDALMKRLTGGDKITARYHFKNPITWDPTHQLLYVTNHKPKTNGDDYAVFRRMRVIPFDVVIPEDEQDLELGETLLLHADAVLTWAVEGYFDHADNGGMREPAAVVEATAAYQHESDDISRFIEEQCEVGRGLQVLFADLWQAWMNWRDDEGAEVVAKKVFADALGKRGFTTIAGAKGVKIRRGISLKFDEES